MTAPKPMDPARLDELRRSVHPVTHPSFTELLADRDYHAKRADELFKMLSCETNELSDAVELAVRLANKHKALEAEIARLRARVRVEAEDVERAGVTWAHVEAWLLANGWEQQVGRGLPHNHGGYFVHWRRSTGRFTAPDVVCVYEHEAPGNVATTILGLARHHQRPGLDILDEMAAMEPTSD